MKVIPATSRTHFR